MQDSVCEKIKKQKAVNFFNNLICAFMAVSVFAMIGIEYGNSRLPANSSTQRCIK